MYDYPLNYEWTTDEIIDVMNLYNAVEKAYEGGIDAKEFKEAYRQFKTIVNTKSEEKQLDKQFKEISGYSIYRVVKESEKNEWIEL